MRERLVIGAIVALVIGVAACVLSQPEEGTVEWHKREYLRAKDDILQRLRPVDRVVEQYHKLRKRPYVYQSRFIDADRRMIDNWDALRQAGYLREEAFSLEHQPKSRIAMLVRRAAEKEISARIWEVAVASGPQNDVVVFAPAEEMGKFEQLVAIFDIPP